MPGCLPARYRLLDLGFALCGTAAFLVDLGSDVWSAWRYYKAGDTVWAVLNIGLYLLSSFVLQFLSWGWFWVDWQEWGFLEKKQTPNGASSGAVKSNASGGAVQTCADRDYAETSNGDTKHRAENGSKYSEEASQVTSADTAVSVVDAVPCDPMVVPPETLCPPDTTNGVTPPQNRWTETTPEEHATLNYTDPSAEEEPIVKQFYTSKIILWPSCFTLLHILQLGYLLRCIHSLEVGIAAYRNPKDDLFKDYAYFLTHDISFMRLMETFLENTPQLILVLYIIIQKEAIEPFQYFSISISFICISWAILDYHQSLRLFLLGKRKLSILSSAIYYLWNFCLITSRILCIMLFAVTFHWCIAVHFFSVWLVFFVWANLQDTNFMKHRFLEIVYRATVAIILYFSWFNIADGRTVYRCIIYHSFILIDSVILVVSWVILKFPSVLEMYVPHIIVTTSVIFAVGLILRFLYYMYLHPNVHSKKQYYDVPDGIAGVQINEIFFSEGKTIKQTNERMKYIAGQIY